MQHVIRYEGGYERNFGTLRSHGSEYEGDDGDRHLVMPWPKGGDGVRFSFNTDGPEMLQTTLRDELRIAVNAGIVTKDELVQCGSWAREASFIGRMDS